MATKIATKELTIADKPEGLQARALTMALAILADHIRGLPKDDRDDLYELMQEIPGAETEEDLQQVFAGMSEILAQEQMSLTKLSCDDKAGDGLQKWIDFVAERIKSLREAAGLTQTELAEKSGLPQSHISRLEGRKHSPSRATLEKIAKALSVKLAELDPSA